MIAENISASEPAGSVNLLPAYRRAIRATEEGQAALVEGIIKPMRTPELPDDWSV